MSINEVQDSMDLEISKRLNNPGWDIDIASRVISIRRQRIKRNLLVAVSGGSMLVAAAVVFAFFINTSAVKTNDLQLFLSKQVDGIHNEVFKGSYSDKLMNVNYTEDVNTPVDRLITNALYIR